MTTTFLNPFGQARLRAGHEKTQAAYEANLDMLAKYDARNGDALQRLVDKGVQLTPYSDEIMQAAEKASFELYEQDASNDAAFKEVYDNWKAFRENVNAWNGINELSFSRFIHQG
jgi:TRAP-type mannitol/chloroaromatic compound transport system substrate-binding protein